MRPTCRLFLLLVLLVAGLGYAPASPALAQTAYPPCPEGTLQFTDSSENAPHWFICVPPPPETSGAAVTWNGMLVVYAHGYESPVDPANPKAAVPPSFAHLTNPVDGTYVPALITGEGFAFGATTYRRTGLVAAEAVEDVAAVAQAGTALSPYPVPTFVVGVSEGGLVTTLALERHPALFAGGLATCGPIGDFRAQTDYFGDFRALYDYFFPDILPGNATNIPTALLAKWDSKFKGEMLYALSQNPVNAGQLNNTVGAWTPLQPPPPESIGLSAEAALWYDVYATANATAVLGGNPYDNKTRVYAGSLDDTALNAGIKRYAASPAALANLGAYQTTGALTKPLVTLHNPYDPVVPAWHEAIYAGKVGVAGDPGKLIQLAAANPYGHCNFTSVELVNSFQTLVAASLP